MAVLRPADEGELREVVAAAAAAALPLELVGGGSKRGLGRPVQAEHVVELGALAGIVAYEPAELVLTARAGTPLPEVEAALAAARQMLAFEPPDWRAVFGGSALQTLGGVLACNAAGPRRFKAGAARDHFLGFRGVSGRGESFKAGGKVVKNVTGYDLPKLLAGSFGTLAALSEITVKVLPRPEETRAVLVHGLDAQAAVQALAVAAGGPYDISGAAHLPGRVAAVSAVAPVARAGAAVTAVRVEGHEPSVAARCAALKEALAGFGAVGELAAADAETLWREIRDVALLARLDDAALWRLSLPPTASPGLIVALDRQMALRGHYLDGAGGTVWLAVDPGGDAGAATIRAALAASGSGHATLIRAADAVRAATPVFQPQAPALAALSARVKDSFDPKRILNPGRMVREF